MGKIISETLAGPDDPIYSEPARSYNPHWSRGMINRIGQHVEILGGMAEFVGKTGRIVAREGGYYRVELDQPVEIPNVGMVGDDLWQGSFLRRVR